MAREELFSVTESFSTVEPEKKALSFQSLELSDEPIQGTSVKPTATVKANEAGTYYVTIYLDGEELQDLGYIDMSAGSELPISGSSFTVPESDSFDLTVKGGFEA